MVHIIPEAVNTKALNKCGFPCIVFVSTSFHMVLTTGAKLQNIQYRLIALQGLHLGVRVCVSVSVCVDLQ